MRLNLNLKIPWNAQIRKWHEPEMHQKSSFQRKSGIIFTFLKKPVWGLSLEMHIMRTFQLEMHNVQTVTHKHYILRCRLSLIVTK